MGRVDDKLSEFLPLFQIIGELEPAKRQILLTHLDTPSTKALIRSIADLLTLGDVNLPPELKSKIRRAVRSNRSAFKVVCGSGAVGKKRNALTAVGGGPLALLLSTVIPLLLGKILK